MRTKNLKVKTTTNQMARHQADWQRLTNHCNKKDAKTTMDKKSQANHEALQKKTKRRHRLFEFCRRIDRRVVTSFR